MDPENWADDFEQIVDRHHRPIDAFTRGDHEPLKSLYSERDDVTLGNPFGPFVRGFDQVVETMRRAATYYREGEATGFDEISKIVTPDLAMTVEVERLVSKIGGSDVATPVSLRCSCVFRREDGTWKLVHRHADPITSARPPESVVQK